MSMIKKSPARLSKKMLATVAGYGLKFLYSAGGNGIGIVRDEERNLTFRREDGSLYGADGHYYPSKDGGHYAEEWRYIGDEGEFSEAQVLSSEFGPKYVPAVEWLLENGDAISRMEEEERNRKLDERIAALVVAAEKSSVGAVVARETRKWLKEECGVVRFPDGYGNKVILHKEEEGRWTVVYEGKCWAYDFIEDAYEMGWPDALGCEVGPLSSYEVEVRVHNYNRNN